MEAFEIADLLQQQERSAERYLEFLKVPGISTGIYALPQGAVDTQQPHTEDEDRRVGLGTVVFVGAEVKHRFHSITEDLTIFVVFAPARGSQARV